MASYVYLFLAQNGLVKIGRSVNPDKRLNSFRGGAIDIELLYKQIVENSLKIERHLHKEFEGKRVRGEWFKLDPEDIFNIAEFLWSYRAYKGTSRRDSWIISAGTAKWKLQNRLWNLRMQGKQIVFIDHGIKDKKDAAEI